MKPQCVSHADAMAYGFLALPLAFVALPMYVNVPHFYATHLSVPLALLGFVLLGSRLMDALTDPFLGRLSDWLYAQTRLKFFMWAGCFALLLAVAFAALFNPPHLSDTAFYAAWVGLCVTVCHLAYSGLSILHQAWATRLGGDAVQQSQVLAWREGAGLWGVVMAAMLPVWLSWTQTAALLGLLLGLGLWAWHAVFQREETSPLGGLAGALHSLPMNWHFFAPFNAPAFAKLLLIFVINGIASAVPASLVLFFVEDQIRAPASQAPLFLGAYFLSGALSLPLWLKAIQRFDLPRIWLAGMLLAVFSFMGVTQLGAGDVWPFFCVCLASGTALGADLVVPGAMLNGLIQRLGHRGKTEGLYLGWWNLATKLNLALAAGLSLPLLSWWGYVPGAQHVEGLHALTWAYGLFPCALKLCAAFGLYNSRNSI